MTAQTPMAMAKDQWWRHSTRTARFGPPLVEQLIPDCDIAKAMGPRDWCRLKPAIRDRFERLSACDGEMLYQGTMHVVTCNFAGLIFAQLSRLIGTPLAPYRGQGIATDVAVYRDTKRTGKVWDRRYRFPNQSPISVRSTKVLDAHNQLLECVGARFGMELHVFERHHALHFLSKRYFWDAPGFRVYIPDLLTPGQAHVVHTDLGNGEFRFRISMTHSVLGDTFFQEGDFREAGIAETGDPG